MTRIPASVVARQIAEQTSDAYSFDRYGSWLACATLLVRRGYSVDECEAILRSKWMRWAADASSNRYGRCSSADLARYLDKQTNLKARVRELVVGTFGSAAAV